MLKLYSIRLTVLYPANKFESKQTNSKREKKEQHFNIEFCWISCISMSNKYTH